MLKKGLARMAATNAHIAYLGETILKQKTQITKVGNEIFVKPAPQSKSNSKIVF